MVWGGWTSWSQVWFRVGHSLYPLTLLKNPIVMFCGNGSQNFHRHHLSVGKNGTLAWSIEYSIGGSRGLEANDRHELWFKREAGPRHLPITEMDCIGRGWRGGGQVTFTGHRQCAWHCAECFAWIFFCTPQPSSEIDTIVPTPPPWSTQGNRRGLRNLPEVKLQS